MKRRVRISAVLAVGILLLCAGLIGLAAGPDLIQYAFLPAEEEISETLGRLDRARTALGETFSRMTLHGQKTGVTLTAGDVSQNDICLYLTGPGWSDVYPRRFISGRPIAGADTEEGAKVIVLDEETAFKLFGMEEAVGQTVTLGTQKLEVVGVAAHSRRIGETEPIAAWAPLGIVTDCEMMTLTACVRSGASMLSVFRNAAEEAFGRGTVISLSKERMRATMMPRWIALIAAVWLLKKWVKRLGAIWRESAVRVRAESERRYALRLIPYAVAKMLPAVLLTAATVAAGYGLAVFAVSPAYVFPEWIPESLGDFSKWGERFWNLTGIAAEPVALKTPELAEIRFWGGFVRWGTVLTLAGGLLSVFKSDCSSCIQ